MSPDRVAISQEFEEASYNLLERSIPGLKTPRCVYHAHTTFSLKEGPKRDLREIIPTGVSSLATL